eukprot:TRINITY_DN15147_c0_g1_i1.p1 TRINITY_DN15147_c0_g1~~TRINITY_DN15147_c0_g1_i1.p1  ORF type:complete len:568 (+),score=79.46 TRINITY_DN15147_c0_g1_i1:44-1747(+)
MDVRKEKDLSRSSTDLFPRGSPYTPFLSAIKCLENMNILDNENCLVELCSGFTREYMSKPFIKKYGLTEDEVFAVIAYTFDFNNTNKRKENIYYRLNKLLRDKVPTHEKQEEWKDYLFHLLLCLKRLPTYQNQVYRGLDKKVDTEREYKLGTIVIWHSFTSATTRLDTAKTFLASSSKEGTIFVVNSTEGKLIKEISSRPEEDEVLFQPNSRFRVNEINTKDKILYVHLKQESTTEPILNTMFSSCVMEVDKWDQLPKSCLESLVDYFFESDWFNTLVIARVNKHWRQTFFDLQKYFFTKSQNIPITEKFKSLRKIIIHARCTQHPFNHFTHLVNLQHLELYAYNFLNEACFTVLKAIKSLQILKLEYVNQLDDVSVKALAQLTTLKSLQLSVIYENSNPTDEGIKHLSNLHQLEALAIENIQAVTNSGITFLSGLTALHTLKVDLDNVKGDFLKGCNSLKALEIRFMTIEPSFIFPQNLSQITLVCSDIPENVMWDLSALQHLTLITANRAIEEEHAKIIQTLKLSKPYLQTRTFRENMCPFSFCLSLEQLCEAGQVQTAQMQSKN